MRPDVLTVPMGLPAAPAPAAGNPLRDHFGAIGRDDPLVLWWGSVWRWLDAGTVVEAVGRLASHRPDIRFVITAGRPSNAATDPLNVTEEVRDQARRSGLLDRNVFFLDEWIPFAERDRFLADADVGITLHADTPEASIAARSRYMDCVWAALPTVLAAGDETADHLAAAGAAVLVPPRDPAATAARARATAGRPEPARLGACRLPHRRRRIPLARADGAALGADRCSSTRRTRRRHGPAPRRRGGSLLRPPRRRSRHACEMKALIVSPVFDEEEQPRAHRACARRADDAARPMGRRRRRLARRAPWRSPAGSPREIDFMNVISLRRPRGRRSRQPRRGRERRTPSTPVSTTRAGAIRLHRQARR